MSQMSKFRKHSKIVIYLQVAERSEFNFNIMNVFMRSERVNYD